MAWTEATARIPLRLPFHADALLAFLAARAVGGVEVVEGKAYARTLRLPAGTGVVQLTLPSPADEQVAVASFRLTSPADLPVAIQRCRRLLDADTDPGAIAAVLGRDPALAAAVRASPGLRVPGAVDGPEIAFRAMVGQQISVPAARTTLARLTQQAGETMPSSVPTSGPFGAGLTHLFPSAAALAALGPRAIGGPSRRAAAIIALAEVIADGSLVIDASRSTAELTADLVCRPGIGPWTAGYVAMRALADTDILLTGDLVLRQGAAALGLPEDPAALARHADRWRPYRSYASMYLWRSAPKRVRRAQPNSIPPRRG